MRKSKSKKNENGTSFTVRVFLGQKFKEIVRCSLVLAFLRQNMDVNIFVYFQEEDDEPLANVASPPSEDYEVESIVGVRKRKGQTEYQVRWKGYAADADTWEPEEQLNCQELIDAFNKKVD